MEVTAPQQVKEVAGIADIMWVGARNMQNFELLKEIGKYPHAVILKRGFIATIKEWICAATYIGVEKVIFCERGIRTGVDAMRFTLDLNGMLVMKHDHKHPVVVDISHSPGRRDMVLPLGYAAMAAGADGIIVETHYNPDEELVDRAQTIDLQSFDGLVKNRNRFIIYCINDEKDKYTLKFWKFPYLFRRQYFGKATSFVKRIFKIYCFNR